MCGIIGIFSENWDSVHDENLNNSLELLRNRGPNDKGIERFNLKNGSLGLGHTRLSIIDLSEAGHQPMSDKDKRFHIIFNGEIYNYCELREELIKNGIVFFSDSDTEVLLKSWIFWGEECINRLTGMFAFAIYDSYDETIVLVRDAFGIKPLFYSNSSNQFSFASEIRAILNLVDENPEIDIETSYSYLIHGTYDNLESTFIKNVSQLAPGHIANIKLSDPSKIEIKRWWNPSIELNSQLSFDEAAAKLRDIFLKNIKLHLRSDVPLCVNLSGGIDSSSIACSVRHIYKDIDINTVSFVSPGSEHDEEYWIDLVNEHINAIPHKVTLDGSDLSDDIDDMFISQGEPFVSSSVYASYSVFESVRENGFTVSLDGQGADELLAGYDGYPNGVIASMISKKNYLEIFKFLFAWKKWPGRSYFGALKYASKNISNFFIMRILYFISGRNLKPNWINAKYIPNLKKIHNRNTSTFNQEHEVPGRSLMGALRAALTSQGLPALLRHGDRNSMRWSIESRVPFLTTELAEFALGLPEEYLISSNGESKSIFRQAMRGIVPDAILDRRDKIGFRTPELDWIMSEKDSVRGWIEYSNQIKMLNGKKFIDEIESVLEGKKPYTAQAWRMISFCKWAKLNNLK